jgi:mannose-6-phosphate isomerase-like protein (cupin superfamily)
MEGEINMDAFEISELYQRQQESGKLYLEFLRVPSMSAGLYVLPAGGVDPQNPHHEDEVYYIVSGRGRIMVGGEDRDVQAGSFIYVPAQVEHRFHTITEELHILVLFAPPEST